VRRGRNLGRRGRPGSGGDGTQPGAVERRGGEAPTSARSVDTRLGFENKRHQRPPHLQAQLRVSFSSAARQQRRRTGAAARARVPAERGAGEGGG
jgi:hypothetical protein